jgi:hypothetical protein
MKFNGLALGIMDAKSKELGWHEEGSAFSILCFNSLESICSSRQLQLPVARCRSEPENHANAQVSRLARVLWYHKLSITRYSRHFELHRFS